MWFDPHGLQKQEGIPSKVTKVTKVGEVPRAGNGTLDSLDTLDTPDPRPAGPGAAAIVPFDQLISPVETALEGARFVGVQPKGWLPGRGVGLDLPPLRAVWKASGECGSSQPCRYRSTSSMPLSNVRKLAIGVGTELHHLELRRALNVDARL